MASSFSLGVMDIRVVRAMLECHYRCRKAEMTLLVPVTLHPDPLVSLLCEQLAHAAPASPFAHEVVARPDEGYRWVADAADRVRIFAAPEGRATASAPTSISRRPTASCVTSCSPFPNCRNRWPAWQGPDLVAHIIASIDANVREPWMRLLGRYLALPTVQNNRARAGSRLARRRSRACVRPSPGPTPRDNPRMGGRRRPGKRW